MFNYQNLESKQFEELCCDIMSEITGKQLHRFSSGRDGGVDLTDDSDTHNIVVQVKHYQKSSFKTLRANLAKELENVKKLSPSQYYVCVSQQLTDANVKDIYQMFSPYMASTSNIFTLNDIDDFLHKNKRITKKHMRLWAESGMALQIMGEYIIGIIMKVIVGIIIIICVAFILIKPFGKRESVPEVYSSRLSSYSKINSYHMSADIPIIGTANECLQQFDYAFSIISNLMNKNEDLVKVDRITTTITEMELDETIEIKPCAVIYQNKLIIFLINDSWGDSENVSVDFFYNDNEKEEVLEKLFNIQYKCQDKQLDSGGVFKAAVFDLDSNEFLKFTEGYLERNGTSALWLQCRINDGIDTYEKSVGTLVYDESSGFRLTSGDRDIDEMYSIQFLKLDVDKVLDCMSKSDSCNISFIGSKAYPVIDHFLTIETVIAPTKSCYLKCYNTYDIVGNISRTEEYWTHVKVPYYSEGMVDINTSFSSMLAKADAEGASDLKSIVNDYKYDADEIMPHDETDTSFVS